MLLRLTVAAVVSVSIACMWRYGNFYRASPELEERKGSAAPLAKRPKVTKRSRPIRINEIIQKKKKIKASEYDILRWDSLPSSQFSEDSSQKLPHKLNIARIESLIFLRKFEFAELLNIHEKQSTASCRMLTSFETKGLSNQTLCDLLLKDGYLSEVINVDYYPENVFYSIEYQFIKVSCGELSFIMDPNFREQFQLSKNRISQFQEFYNLIPVTFVGPPENLVDILVILSEVMALCFEYHNLCLPPWRELRYLRKKWLLE